MRELENDEGRGERVIMRCYGNTAATGIVWGRGIHRGYPKVYITNEAKTPIMGWPAEDVFEFDEAVDLNDVKWRELKPWRGPRERG